MTSGNQYLGYHTLPPSYGDGVGLQAQRAHEDNARRGSHSLACALLEAFENIAIRNRLTLAEAMHSQLSGGIYGQT